MFRRFTVCELDPDSQSHKGVFAVAYELRYRDKLSRDESELLKEILEWFQTNLPVPRCFARDPRAVCWFTPDAGEPLTRMWELVSFLEAKDISVRMYKTKDPGARLYRDEYQVVAIPQSRPRMRAGR
jgi:hypothetical protein